MLCTGGQAIVTIGDRKPQNVVNVALPCNFMILVRSEHEPHEAVRVPHSQGQPGFRCSGPEVGSKPRYTLVIKVVNPGVLGYMCA